MTPDTDSTFENRLTNFFGPCKLQAQFVWSVSKQRDKFNIFYKIVKETQKTTQKISLRCHF